MKKIALSAVPVRERISPKGRFHVVRRDISAVHGARDEAGNALHPYEIEYVEIPPGKRNFLYHSHSAEHETYLIVKGQGKLRTPAGDVSITAGDCIHCPPGEPHHMINDSDANLGYYVIANNTAGDVCYYPDSDKWLIPMQQPFRMTQCDFWDGEE
jgi:uncharacterized cupin superfamily protein